MAGVRFRFGLRLALVILVAGIGWGTIRAAAQTPAPAIDLQSLALTPARAEAFLEADRAGLHYLPGEVLVKFKPGMGPSDETRALSSLRSRPDASALHWIGEIATLQDATEPDATVLASELAAQPEVLYAQPNYIRKWPGWAAPESSAATPRALPAQTAAVSTPQSAPSFVPNDTDYANLQWNFSLINMPEAWGINHGSNPSIIVGLIDTGVTTAPTSLTLPLWTGFQFEQVTMPFAGSPDITPTRFVGAQDLAFSSLSGGQVLDMVGHGTHVASTIGEDTNNAFALAGIAYNVRLMPVKVCLGYWELMLQQAAAGVTGFISSTAGGCADDTIAAGIQYAVNNGAHVINISLGGSEPAPAINTALEYAVQHGAFVAIANGNDFANGNPIEYPAFYAASINGVMSVAAVGKSETHAYYSSSGTYTEISAPGGNDQDGGGQDQGFVWQTTLFPPDQDPTQLLRPRFDRYAEVGYEGTSMATPHVVGLAALLMTQGTVHDPAAIEALIEATAKDLGPAGKDDEFGYGLIQPRNALFGFGIK